MRQKGCGSKLLSSSSFVLLWLCLFGTVCGQEILKRTPRSPQHQQRQSQQQHQYQEQDDSSEYEYPSTNYGVPPVSNQPRNSPRGQDRSGHQIARQLMLHNQEVNSGRRVGDLPLYKQSYPGLYTQGELKEFAYEPTHKVTHGNGHHGKEGHLFLLHPDTSHIFRGIAHALHHDNLI